MELMMVLRDKNNDSAEPTIFSIVSQRSDNEIM